MTDAEAVFVLEALGYRRAEGHERLYQHVAANVAIFLPPDPLAGFALTAPLAVLELVAEAATSAGISESGR